MLYSYKDYLVPSQGLICW